MTDPTYVIQLGSGLYLDDQGVLHQGPIPPVPAYPMPGGMLSNVDMSKISKTLADIGNALPMKPGKPDPEKKGADLAGLKAAQDIYDKFVSKLTKLGLPDKDADKVAELLGVIGKVAEVAGTVFIVLGVAVAAAKLLGLFNEGPSPLEQLVDARFKALNATINALQKLSNDQHLNERKNALGAARKAVQQFVTERDSLTLTTTEIENRVQKLTSDLELINAPQWESLLDSITYTCAFDSDKYEKVWPWISGRLFFVPKGSPPVMASFPVFNSPRFDHRLAVLIAPQAAQTLLALVRSLSPEFRTTGKLRTTLRTVADKLSALAISIRNTTLARTIYSETDFGFLITDFFVNDPIPGIIEPTLNPDYFIVVGAMDLCNHDDAFFSNVIKGFGIPAPASSRQGSIDFRWHPPARLERIQGNSGLFHSDGTPVIQYRIVNTKVCADAANDQSLQDYSDLLLSSGYLTLMQLATQMRHAATQPDKSETVQGDVLLLKHPEPGAEVTVVSAPGPILFTATGEIKAKAWRASQKVRAFASCSTQAIPRAQLIQYRIFLRTLPSIVSRSWVEPDYSAVQSTSYIDDPLNAGFKRLFLSTSTGALLDEKLLMEGTSPTEARHFEGRLSFKAHTFDWWIPVQPPLGVSDSVSDTNNDLHVFKNTTSKPPAGLPRPIPKFTLSGSDTIDRSSAASVVMGLGWEDGAQTWEGYHREMQESTVDIHVKLDWQGSKVRLEIDGNRGVDRNYIMFLVVEEKFGTVETDETGPKVLHTAFPIAVNGQLTFVPQSLFDQEAEARKGQRAFAERFAVSVNPKPGAPVFGMISMGELTTDAGVAHLAAELRQFGSDALEKLTRGEDAGPEKMYDAALYKGNY